MRVWMLLCVCVCEQVRAIQVVGLFYLHVRQNCGLVQCLLHISNGITLFLHTSAGYHHLRRKAHVTAIHQGMHSCMYASAACAASGAQGSPQVVVVNPGRLTKGSSGGTYAHVTVVPGSGSLASRCRVDIVRV